jgi:FAD/FMN-containing dehydrogenase
MQTLQTHPNGYHLGGYKGHHLVPGTAVTVGAGMVMSDIFEHLDRLNQTIVGGSGRTVGVAGYVTGGGHSPLSPRYGLAADNVLEMELVTPTGDIVVANEFTNRSLFWALRGVSSPRGSLVGTTLC